MRKLSLFAITFLALTAFVNAEQGDIILDIGIGPSIALIDLGSGFVGAGPEGGATLEWEAFSIPLTLSARLALSAQPLDIGSSVMAIRASTRLSYDFQIAGNLSLSPFTGVGIYAGLLAPSAGIAGATAFLEIGTKASLRHERLVLGLALSYDFHPGLFHALRILVSTGITIL